MTHICDMHVLNIERSAHVPCGRIADFFYREAGSVWTEDCRLPDRSARCRFHPCSRAHFTEISEKEYVILEVIGS